MAPNSHYLVQLGEERQSGRLLHSIPEFHGEIPVIGVAKSRYKDTPRDCELIRGQSLKPLYITSVGIELEKAKEFISSMHGKHRIPTLLKIVEMSSKED